MNVALSPERLCAADDDDNNDYDDDDDDDDARFYCSCPHAHPIRRAQENAYYFNPTRNTWEWHEAEAKKRGMHLASVTSKEELALIYSITKGTKAWIGGCRKSTSSQRSDTLLESELVRFRGPDDWEWSDGTPWSLDSWSHLEPNNGGGTEDRVHMSKNQFFDSESTTIMPGIYRKARYEPPFEAIRAIVTDRLVLSKCFTASDEFRGILIRVLSRMLSYNSSAAPTQKAASAISKMKSIKRQPSISAIASHVKTEWSSLNDAFRAVRYAPEEFSRNHRYCFEFLAHLAAASAILEAPAPNAWQPLPASSDDWCWPPAPLAPLRDACKIIQKLSPQCLNAVWPVTAGLITTLLVRMVDAVRANLAHAVDLLTAVYNRERMSSLETYRKQLRRARRDPTYPEFKATADELIEQLAKLKRNELRMQTTASFPKLYSIAHDVSNRFNAFLAKLAQKCAGAEALQAPLKGIVRALEKVVFTPGAAAKVKRGGLKNVNSKYLVDVLRGSMKCSDFTNIVFLLDMLQRLDVDLGNPARAKAEGWDLDKFQIRIINIKDRFVTPTSGGWADAMVNFTFAHGDDTHLVMELQLQVSSLIAFPSLTVTRNHILYPDCQCLPCTTFLHIHALIECPVTVMTHICCAYLPSTSRCWWCGRKAKHTRDTTHFDRPLSYWRRWDASLTIRLKRQTRI